MQINEIENNGNFNKDLSTMLLRKVSRQLKYNPHAFPSWFKFLKTSHSSPVIQWPVRGKEIEIVNNPTPLKVTSDTYTYMYGWTLGPKGISVSNLLWIYFDNRNGNGNNLDKSSSPIAKFVADIIINSDPIFHQLNVDDFQERQYDKSGSETSVMIACSRLPAIVYPDLSKYQQLIHVLFEAGSLDMLAAEVQKVHP